MNQKYVRFIGLFSLVMAFSALVVVGSKAEIASAVEDTEIGINNNHVTENTQDSFVGVDTNVVTENTQDGGAGINTNSVTEDTQDGGTGINTNSVTENTQDGGTGINTNPVTEDTQDGDTGNGGNGGNGDITTNPVTEDTQDGVPGGGDNGGGTGGDNGGTPADDDRTGGGGGSRRNNLSNVSPEVIAGSNLNQGPAKGGSCVYLTQYLKFGGDNNPGEVRKLQLFLKNSEKLDVDVNNVFDAKTLKAVEAFQAKYLSDVMGPWGATIPSGQVYISTTKKINELNCKNPLSFSKEDLAVFAEYRNLKALGLIGEDGLPIESDLEDISDISLDLDEVEEDNGRNGNVASALVGFGMKVGGFFKGIFDFLFRK